MGFLSDARWMGAALALAGMALDAVLTGGAWDTRAAQKATRTIPIQTVSDDVLQEGLVESLAHPAGIPPGSALSRPSSTASGRSC